MNKQKRTLKKQTLKGQVYSERVYLSCGNTGTETTEILDVKLEGIVIKKTYSCSLCGEYSKIIVEPRK